MMCARCGAQNPDGTLYCMNCGTPLTAGPPAVATAAPPGPPPGIAPPGPPPGIAPPMAAPAAYQSPYYMPTGPVAPVHRTPWMLIIAGVVALVVLMAGCGTALAILGNQSSTNTTSASDVSSPDVSSPNPGVTPSPIASPTTPPSGATESNDGLTIPVPAGWSVATKDSEAIVLTDPNGAGSVTAASGQSSPVQSAVQNKVTIDQYFKDNYPDTRTCPATTATNGTFNGVHGVSWTLCFTLTAGGHSVPAAASLFAGANSSGSVYYIVMLVARQDNLKTYVAAAKPVLQGIHWKLS